MSSEHVPFIINNEIEILFPFRKERVILIEMTGHGVVLIFIIMFKLKVLNLLLHNFILKVKTKMILERIANLFDNKICLLYSLQMFILKKSTTIESKSVEYERNDD